MSSLHVLLRRGWVVSFMCVSVLASAAPRDGTFPVSGVVTRVTPERIEVTSEGGKYDVPRKSFEALFPKAKVGDRVKVRIVPEGRVGGESAGEKGKEQSAPDDRAFDFARNP